jgi:hypothetical protein
MDTTSNPERNLARHLARVIGLPCLAMAMFGIVRAQQAGAGDPGQEVAATRDVIEKWVETRQVLSREKRDWEIGREHLLDRIEVLQSQTAVLLEKIKGTEESISQLGDKRAELQAEGDLRKATEDGLIAQVAALEKRTRELLPRLPEPLRDQVKPVAQLIPAEGEETKQRLDERFRNVLFVLKQVHKWNREITVRSEVRNMPDGTTVEVAVLYVGIGQAYYAGASGKVAGIGNATEAGWVWTPMNEIAPDVATAIAILKNEKVAAFVRLPVKVL